MTKSKPAAYTAAPTTDWRGFVTQRGRSTLFRLVVVGNRRCQHSLQRYNTIGRSHGFWNQRLSRFWTRTCSIKLASCDAATNTEMGELPSSEDVQIVLSATSSETCTELLEMV